MGLRDWWNSLKAEPAGSADIQITPTSAVYFRQEEPELTQARHAATAHAREGNYAAAVADLERALEFQASNGSPADCATEIRCARYLQKAGRGEEAWQVFQRLLARHQTDPWLLVDLLDALRLHLQRENMPREAIHYGTAMRLAQVKLYRDWRRKAESALDSPTESYGDKNLERLIRDSQSRDIELCNKWLTRLTDAGELMSLAKPLCKKAGIPEQADALVARMQAEIAQQTDPLDYLRARGVSFTDHRGSRHN